MITFENICKRYREYTVLSDISFRIDPGDVVVLIGPSGCGKTTSLKMINRLLSPTSGRILIDGKDISDVDVVKLRRNMGYVIQNIGLIPHMTVRENIELIPRLEGYDRKRIVARNAELMEMIGLDPDDYLDRYPTQLSGGQQQRVGVARAFACDPDIILMDEPFSAVDPITRSQLQNELSNLQEKLRKTIVFVTHDIDEAVKIGDRICLLNEGKIVQYGTCEEILKNPANDFVKEFVGNHRIWATPELILARDVMMNNPVTCPADASVQRCLERIRKANVNVALLVEKGKLLGIASSSALRKCENKAAKAISVADTSYTSILPDESIISILTMVNASDANLAPVVDKNGVLRGLITKGSLINTMSQRFIDDDKTASQKITKTGEES
ncbi:MAG: ABC transporter ATP-binding protein [Planctomycetes bacterium]|nr:ABC transporter ATP-binding protein [Planctomycetota bacterium]